MIYCCQRNVCCMVWSVDVRFFVHSDLLNGGVSLFCSSCDIIGISRWSLLLFGGNAVGVFSMAFLWFWHGRICLCRSLMYVFWFDIG